MGIKRERRTVRIIPALVSATLLGGGVLVGPSVAQAATGTGTAADTTGVSTITTASSPNLALDSAQQVDCPRVYPPPNPQVFTPTRTYSYRTDAQGRPSSGTAGVLTAGRAMRTNCEGEVGRMGGPGYQGGHLIAASLNGISRRYNLVPMTNSVNLGAMAVMENAAKRCLRRGMVRNYTTQVTYSGTRTLVPNHIAVSFSTRIGRQSSMVNGDFRNAVLSRGTLTRLKNAVKRQTVAAGCG